MILGVPLIHSSIINFSDKISTITLISSRTDDVYIEESFKWSFFCPIRLIHSSIWFPNQCIVGSFSIKTCQPHTGRAGMVSRMLKYHYIRHSFMCFFCWEGVFISSHVTKSARFPPHARPNCKCCACQCIVMCWNLICKRLRISSSCVCRASTHCSINPYNKMRQHYLSAISPIFAG